MSVQEYVERAKAFAQAEIAGRGDLLASKEFPHDIWEKLGSQSLLGLSIAQTYGGVGLSYADLGLVAESFAEAACCPGMAMSWLGHNLMARLLVQEIGTQAQRDDWLPKIASGDVTTSVAISEPGAGAHPKFLKMTAERTGDGYYSLRGEKAFVTNGPIAGLFVVLAITAEVEGRKEFTAFLVPGDAQGLSRHPMDKEIDFLRPSPHCRLIFDNVLVSETAILGEVGNGFETVSKKVRHVEDAIGLSVSSGNFAAEIGRLAEALAKSTGDVNDDAVAAIGTLAAKQVGLSHLARAALAELDGPESGEIIAAFRSFLRDAQALAGQLVEDFGINLPERDRLLMRDITKGLEIASRAHMIQNKNRGEKVIAAHKSPRSK